MRDVYERNAIIGGVCGGVALIAIVAVTAVLIRKKVKAGK